MVEVKFSDIGEGMNEGEIIHYFVKVGDEVNVDQPLVELQTDKMVAEIPAPAAGKIKNIHYDAGDVVTVGTVLMEIENNREKASSSDEMEEQHATATKEYSRFKMNKPKHKKFDRVLAAPYTRKIARDNDVDIETIQGTGPSGRVTEEDVLLVANQTSSSSEEGFSQTQVDVVDNEQETLGDTIPYKGIRKQTGIKLSHSLNTIPHVTHFDEADVTNLLEFRNELKESGENISVASFFVKAIVIALKEFRIFNAQLDEENEVIHLLKDYNIGIATNTKEGLLVPVINDVDQKSIRTISTEMKALTVKAQEGKITSDDMKQGTFTVNNVGPLGGIAATPIINHPQTGIMTFHKTKKRPVITDDDEIVIRSIMTLSFSFDHRVADGAESIAFVNRFIDLIESPKKLLLELI
ncbi:dihydrolipoamide acetyltransferase family protein [Virgibacillus kekensis]|uniref:Dihydrolipoamide acetyltransferase component of pyruvate dehydrogenase complex n=1 Tax=Virgibacillus kekensis TaxID=202261 RepID=A0ABV9DJH7_9BACI